MRQMFAEVIEQSVKDGTFKETAFFKNLMAHKYGIVETMAPEDTPPEKGPLVINLVRSDD